MTRDEIKALVDALQADDPQLADLKRDMVGLHEKVNALTTLVLKLGSERSQRRKR